MGWGRYLLLGNFGQQLDLQDRQREIERLRHHLDSQWSRDRTQDAQIAALREEIHDLKLYLASLVRLLASKQLVTQAEIEDLVQMIENDPTTG